MLKLPGLIDPHVHIREPGATHKEDWTTGTAAALAGGFTLVLAMPNTNPPITDASSLELVLATASHKARCDYACYLGANADNTEWEGGLAAQAAGLKCYLDATYGPLQLGGSESLLRHLRRWPQHLPLVCHAEGSSLVALIELAERARRPVHIAHVATRDDILLVRGAKQRGVPITCEVTPHHLFLTEDDMTGGRSEVRPRLGTRRDQAALWDNLDVVDCFATDHAPHTLAEKEGPNPPPGFPGLETALPLLLTAVTEGRLTLDDLLLRMSINPARIFCLPTQTDTWVEVDQHAGWEIQAVDTNTRSGWTPFEGWHVQGRVRRVLLRGKEAYRDGAVLATPGYGRNVRDVAG